MVMANTQVNPAIPVPGEFRLPDMVSDGGDDRRSAGSRRPEMTRLMHENAVWFCQLRWVVAALLALAGILGFFPAEFSPRGLQLTPTWPLTTALVLVVLNLGY
jgi:hypothetical protein